jgi:hypothetical protein
VSGQNMLLALLQGGVTPEEIAQLARGTAKRKIPQLINSLEGHRMTDHLRFVICSCLRHFRSGSAFGRYDPSRNGNRHECISHGRTDGKLGWVVSRQSGKRRHSERTANNPRQPILAHDPGPVCLVRSSKGEFRFSDPLSTTRSEARRKACNHGRRSFNANRSLLHVDQRCPVSRCRRCAQATKETTSCSLSSAVPATSRTSGPDPLTN